MQIGLQINHNLVCNLVWNKCFLFCFAFTNKLCIQFYLIIKPPQLVPELQLTRFLKTPINLNIITGLFGLLWPYLKLSSTMTILQLSIIWNHYHEVLNGYRLTSFIREYNIYGLSTRTSSYIENNNVLSMEHIFLPILFDMHNLTIRCLHPKDYKIQNNR